jgi:hypothetical protein
MRMTSNFTRVVRVLVVLVVPLAGVAACAPSGVSRPGPVRATSRAGARDVDCAWVLRYDGRRYDLARVGAETVVARHHGARLGRGTLLGCADGPTSDQRVTVYRVAGVSPRVAVATSDEGVVGVSRPGRVPAALRALVAVR